MGTPDDLSEYYTSPRIRVNETNAQQKLRLDGYKVFNLGRQKPNQKELP
jgi:hypothetical protein